MKRNTLIAIAAAGAVIAGGTIGGVALASGSGGGEQELRGTEQAAAAVDISDRDDDRDDRDDRDDDDRGDRDDDDRDDRDDDDRDDRDDDAEREQEQGRDQSQDAGQGQGQDQGQDGDSRYSRVTALALSEAPGFVTDLERDHRDNGTVVWEVDIFGTDGQWYDVEINEDGTEVLRSHLDNDDDDDDDRQVIPSSGIDIVEAILIAEQHTGAAFKDADLDDDGRHWEIELRGDGYEHEVKVAVATGEVTAYEKENDDD
ncbi:PepSY domain-containing protein [Streptomyces harbinensis]|uniref:PepSY domain-containing protein n=1 Tax=Streptomyces harbinensis TaxID=1176198 RepID=UPI0037248E04